MDTEACVRSMPGAVGRLKPASRGSAVDRWCVKEWSQSSGQPADWLGIGLRSIDEPNAAAAAAAVRSNTAAAPPSPFPFAARPEREVGPAGRLAAARQLGSSSWRSALTSRSGLVLLCLPVARQARRATTSSVRLPATVKIARSGLHA